MAKSLYGVRVRSPLKIFIGFCSRKEPQNRDPSRNSGKVSGNTPGSGMRAIDTNVLVRLIARDDEDQAASADAFIEKGAWVSILALAETMWVLAAVYERSAADLATVVQMLLNHETLTLQDSDVVASALSLFQVRPALRFSDCLLLETARKAGHLPLGTFDRGLARIEGAKKL